MFKALEGLMPSFFSSEEEYETQKQHVFAVLQENTRLGLVPAYSQGLTRRELTEKLPYRHSTVTGRLAELKDQDVVWAEGKRECSVADHDREVEELVAIEIHEPEEIE